MRRSIQICRVPSLCIQNACGSAYPRCWSLLPSGTSAPEEWGPRYGEAADDAPANPSPPSSQENQPAAGVTRRVPIPTRTDPTGFH